MVSYKLTIDTLDSIQSSSRYKPLLWQQQPPPPQLPPLQQQQHPPPPPPPPPQQPQPELTMEKIIAVVDPVFYAASVNNNSIYGFIDAVKAKYNITELPRTARNMIKKRLSTLNGQPSEQKLKSLVDKSFVEADNTNEDTAVIISVVRSKWLELGDTTEPNRPHTAELTDQTIKAIKKRLHDWRRGRANGVRRLKKTEDGNGLLEDKLFANIRECVNDVNDLLHQQSHQPMDEETNNGEEVNDLKYNEINKRKFALRH